MKKSTIIRLSAVSVLIILVLVSAACHRKGSIWSFETAKAKIGSIVNTVTATGTVQADTTVSVGTQVSGVIKKIYVDFNSPVRKGQILAMLDTVPLVSAVQQAEAALESARSQVEFQTATYERYKALIEKNLVARADYDQVKYNYDNATANLKTAQAGYDRAIVNLNYATITSPIKGVVLNRAVDQGQTVAASFNTPTLFTIGNSLTVTQVQANVDEADIGQVKKGQAVNFSVDAYPSETFSGVVRQVRLQPVVTNNVVTYTVIVNAPNPDLKLMPGMTANITILVQKIDSILIIPGKALRFTPDQKYIEQNKSSMGNDSTSSLSAQGQGGFNQNSGRDKGMSDANPFVSSGGIRNRPPVVWIKNGETIHKARIETGAADGMNTEVVSGLNSGDEVVLSMTEEGKKKTGASQARSPFMPQRPRNRTNQPGQQQGQQGGRRPD